MFKGLLKEISRISTESFHLTEFGDTILKSYPEALEKMHVPPSMCFPLINFVLVFFFSSFQVGLGSLRYGLLVSSFPSLASA